jgi:class 3 adenylate cyclase
VQQQVRQPCVAATTSAGSPCISGVSALAGPNDVLVSSTLRDLVIGSGLEFEERGSYDLKGVPGEWRLFAVAST